MRIMGGTGTKLNRLLTIKERGNLSKHRAGGVDNVIVFYYRLKMKKGTIISRLYIVLDMDDDNYLPERVVVLGGEADNLSKLNEMRINL